VPAQVNVSGPLALMTAQLVHDTELRIEQERAERIAEASTMKKVVDAKFIAVKAYVDEMGSRFAAHMKEAQEAQQKGDAEVMAQASRPPSRQ